MASGPGAAGNGAAVASGEESPLVYKVHLPPKSNPVAQALHIAKETLFYDDSFRQFKHQSKRKKSILGLQYIFPIFDWGFHYTFKFLWRDVIAGLTIASLAVPQDLGYATLAHLPVVHGLYSSFVPPLIYSVLGSSRHIAIGPVAVVSLLLGTLLTNELPYNINGKANPQYLQLALSATFFAGVFQAGLGFLRLGFIIDFLSHATIVGFMAGAAITIGLQQLKGLLNIPTANFTTKTDIVSVLRSAFQHTYQWNWRTIVIGLVFLGFILLTRFLAHKWKKLFFLSAIAPLLSLILATVFTFHYRLENDNVAIVKDIQKGINPSSAHQLIFSGSLVGTAAKIGLVAGLIAITEGIAIGRSFAALEGYHIDGNKEFIAFGVMNLAGSVTSCYVTTGSFSRSAVNYNAGAKTPVSNIVMALTVMVVLLALTPLFKYTPNCILASIIMAAVVSLINVRAAYLIWKVDKFDFIALLGAFFGTLFISVEIGLLIAVSISFVKLLLTVTRPHTALLGNIPGTKVYRNVNQYKDAKQVPGVLAIRLDAPLYFSNSNYIRERILRYLHDEQDNVALSANGLPVQYLILDLTPVINIDVTGIIALEELETALKKKNIQLAISNPATSALEKLANSGFIERLGQQWVFLTVADAVQVTALLVNKNFGEKVV
jgi:high affinity sulfate transporter 1